MQKYDAEAHILRYVPTLRQMKIKKWCDAAKKVNVIVGYVANFL